ncbi:potassium/sodium hyperpolarization-activated cyclic nucleotide-gated channel 2-like isoform X2 [Erinaceus europaeus]|uniref:Potassium/sodium hyperpolarization-activated cyclic nucleotide-gated channel 2-like isoform X2 n=1 Tax=Erinaceus europaeus TaxID=9365 RepID=A0ABM3XCP3_ERIEU|nr:potassium/sodium hyperpolarization-activated cyclic nucleotide-gated channel 2-like isoform X2 [Erinaceus europaeus]
MMMMSRTQPPGEGRRGVCERVGRREGCERPGEGRGGEGSGAGRAPPAGPCKVFSPPPPPPQTRRDPARGDTPAGSRARAPAIDDSACGHGYLSVGQCRGQRSADVMDGRGRGAGGDWEQDGLGGRGGEASVQGPVDGWEGSAGAAAAWELASPTAISRPAKEAGDSGGAGFSQAGSNCQ